MKPCERQEFSQTWLFFFFQFSLRIILIVDNLKGFVQSPFLNFFGNNKYAHNGCLHAQERGRDDLLARDGGEHWWWLEKKGRVGVGVQGVRRCHSHDVAASVKISDIAYIYYNLARSESGRCSRVPAGGRKIHCIMQEPKPEEARSSLARSQPRTPSVPTYAKALQSPEGGHHHRDGSYHHGGSTCA